MPDLEFRLHYYIIALLLLPGTFLRTRPSLPYQGVLLGLFISVATRWEYTSILKTADAPSEDGQLGSALPSVLRPILESTKIFLSIPELASGFGGLSVLVNYVERYYEVDIQSLITFEWSRSD